MSALAPMVSVPGLSWPVSALMKRGTRWSRFGSFCSLLSTSSTTFWRGEKGNDTNINGSCKVSSIKQTAPVIVHDQIKWLSCRSIAHTWYILFPVIMVRSLNSIWIVLTSDTELSGPHSGAWAWPERRFTSENGMPEGLSKQGSSRSPTSLYKEK